LETVFVILRCEFEKPDSLMCKGLRSGGGARFAATSWPWRLAGIQGPRPASTRPRVVGNRSNSCRLTYIHSIAVIPNLQYSSSTGLESNERVA